MFLQVCQELMQRILPGMMLMSPDAFLANEVWSLLQLLPYSVRYEVYEVLAVSSASPQLLALVLLGSDLHCPCQVQQLEHMLTPPPPTPGGLPASRHRNLLLVIVAMG